ncbi:hypothetical protein L1D32_08175 [Shewanella insulae]|uniref:hypothetical protein n=1 Tax=Shewanella insulae TaxID=2681496 RepID=UPI001EFD13E3|nr:hypothetical protein [Shewanella insulae]MCG9713505.1 hypothetical protein [Shewanella insulae]MCG9738130.1 hypothetical protein [Shewanella insulae]
MKSKLLPLIFTLAGTYGANVHATPADTMTRGDVDVSQFIEFSLKEMRADGDFTAMEQVSGIDSDRLEHGFRHAMELCFGKFDIMSQDDESKLETCLLDEGAKAVDVAPEQFAAWIDEVEAQDSERPSSPLDALYDEMDKVNEAIFALEDKDQLSSDEQAKLEALEQKLIELAARREQLQTQETKAVASDMEAILKRD